MFGYNYVYYINQYVFATCVYNSKYDADLYSLRVYNLSKSGALKVH